MLSTMQDRPLLLRDLLRHGRDVFGTSRVITVEQSGSRAASFHDVAARAAQLAGALLRLGIERGDRVGTLSWNTQEHLEAYLAVPAMGGVLHTLNNRLAPGQLAYCINHAADRVLLVDSVLLPVLEEVRDRLNTVEHVIVVDAKGVEGTPLDYEDLLAAQQSHFDWPELDERDGAVMCYTSGTTGDPKGVVYSHRSQLLHALATRGELQISDVDRLLTVVPMFHVNGWGLPYIGWYAGADLVMPGRHQQAARLCEVIQAEQISLSVGVPTVWNDVLRHARTTPVDFSSLRGLVIGGSAVPRTLIDEFRQRHDVDVTQAWGMTETSPIAAVGFPPRDVPSDEQTAWRVKAGRVMPGVELRVVGDDGATLAADGVSAGEIEVRGPWITASYYLAASPSKFRDGWLRTGDVGTLNPRGYVTITDRSKDIIKSGGEWISSVDLENEISAHPDVREAVVVGIPDPRWDERPAVGVVVEPGHDVTVEALREFLVERVARWWIPEHWAFIDAVPRTSVGKYDKKRFRALLKAGELQLSAVQTAESAPVVRD